MPNKWLSTGLAMVCLLTIRPALGQATANQLNAEGIRLLREQRYDEAAVVFQKAIESSSDHLDKATGFINLAVVYAALGQISKEKEAKEAAQYAENHKDSVHLSLSEILKNAQVEADIKEQAMKRKHQQGVERTAQRKVAELIAADAKRKQTIDRQNFERSKTKEEWVAYNTQCLAQSVKDAKNMRLPGPYDTETFIGKELDLTMIQTNSLNALMTNYAKLRRLVEDSRIDQSLNQRVKADTVECLDSIKAATPDCLKHATWLYNRGFLEESFYCSNTAYRALHLFLSKSDPELAIHFESYKKIKTKLDQTEQARAKRYEEIPK